MELHFKITGALLIIVALLHFSFPKYFSWKKELSSLSIMNRQLMYIHSFFIALAVFLTGLLCLSSANELVNTNLGKKISLGLGIFWAIRLFVQFFVYSPVLWRGKKFETGVHILFSVFWAYLSVLFLTAYFN